MCSGQIQIVIVSIPVRVLPGDEACVNFGGGWYAPNVEDSVRDLKNAAKYGGEGVGCVKPGGFYPGGFRHVCWPPTEGGYESSTAVELCVDVQVQGYMSGAVHV